MHLSCNYSECKGAISGKLVEIGRKCKRYRLNSRGIHFVTGQATRNILLITHGLRHID